MREIREMHTKSHSENLEETVKVKGKVIPITDLCGPGGWRLDGPQGRSGGAENLVPTGIRSRTVQPVVSRYTD